MTIGIQNLQPIQSETNSEILQELSDQQLDQIWGGNPAAAFFAGVAVGAVATAAVGATAVAVGAVAYYATN